AWVRHDALLGGPVAGEIRHAVRATGRALRGGGDSFGRRHEPPVAVDARAVGEDRRAEIARARLTPVGRARDLDLLARLEHVLGPARAPQHRGAAQLAAPTRRGAVLDDVEREPR